MLQRTETASFSLTLGHVRGILTEVKLYLSIYLSETKRLLLPHFLIHQVQSLEEGSRILTNDALEHSRVVVLHKDFELETRLYCKEVV
jgi:hypothetical protein